MKKNLLRFFSFYFFFVVVSFNLNAQIGMWAKSFGGTQNEVTNAMVLDTAGNSYAVGTFYGTVDFDPGPGTYTLNSTSVEDAFILKLNASGNFVWAKQFVGTNNEVIYSIAIDAQNNIYTCGYFNGSFIDLDPGPATYSLSSAGGSDIFISKLDAFGNFIWGKRIGDTGGEFANGLNLDAFGNIYITGSYNSSSIDFDPGLGTFILNSPSSLNSAYLVKLNASGNFVWAKKIAGGGGTSGSNIEIDASGNVYTGGTFSSIAEDFDPGIGTYTMTTYGSSDIFISKLDPAGNFVWAKQMGGVNSDFNVSFKINSNNDIYILGFFTGNIDLDPGLANYNLTSLGGSDVFISKLDSNGIFNWAGQIGGPSSQQKAALMIDNSNNIYLTGSMGGITDLDPGVGTYTVNVLGQEMFVTKIDAVGNFIFANHIGETTNMGGLTPRAAVLDAQNSIYMSGAIIGLVDFDPTVNTNTISASLSSFDAFVCKLILPCTVPLAPTQIITPANSIYCNNISNTLIATSAGTVTWHSTPSTTIVLGVGINYVTPVLAQGIYTFYAQSNACTKNINRTAITITVNPLPVVTINSSDSVLCAGQQAVLQCNGANTFFWSTLSPAGNINVSPTVTTIYSVIGTDANGCSNTASYTQSVVVCNYIKSINNTNDNINVFPNPSKGVFNLIAEPGGDLEIFDVTGQILYRRKISSESFVFDLSEFSNGFYFAKIKYNSKENFMKIIKE